MGEKVIKKIALSAMLLFSNNSFTGIGDDLRADDELTQYYIETVDDLKAELAKYYNETKAFIEKGLNELERNFQRHSTHERNSGYSGPIINKDPLNLNFHRSFASLYAGKLNGILDKIKKSAILQEATREEIEDLLLMFESIQKLYKGLSPRYIMGLDEKKAEIRKIASEKKSKPGFANLAGTSSTVLRRAQGNRSRQQPAKPE